MGGRKATQEKLRSGNRRRDWELRGREPRYCDALHIIGGHYGCRRRPETLDLPWLWLFLRRSPRPHHNFIICAFVLEGKLTHIASAFWRSGAKLVLGDLNEEAAATASLVTEAGDEALLRAPVPATNGRDRRGGMTGPETERRSKQQQARDRTSRHL